MRRKSSIGRSEITVRHYIDGSHPEVRIFLALLRARRRKKYDPLAQLARYFKAMYLLRRAELNARRSSTSQERS